MTSKEWAADPRREARVFEFSHVPLPESENGVDVYALGGLMFSAIAVMVGVPVYAWIATICFIASMANMRYHNMDRMLIFANFVMIAFVLCCSYLTDDQAEVMMPMLARSARKRMMKEQMSH